MVKYPEYAKELKDLLKRDQQAWRTFWKDNNKVQDQPLFKTKFERVRKGQKKRSVRMLEILKDINEPFMSNIGADAAQAISVIAVHDSISIIRQVLAAFMKCYERDQANTYIQAIPSLTDRLLLLERKPQRYGTMWESEPSPSNECFLPTVEDFKNVNKRRKEFGIEPLRWPKSLAMPESEQPWLQRPLSELVMRDITDEEFEKNYVNYIE